MLRSKKSLTAGKILLVLFSIALLNFSGCKKIRQGVIEIRTVLLTDITKPINNTYSCFLADDDVTLTSGQVYEPTVAEYYHTRNSNYKEYHVYHENESAKSLGYTEQQDGENTAIGKDYYSNKNNSTTPGENGNWGGDKNPTGNTNGGGGGGGGGGGTGEKEDVINIVLTGSNEDKAYYQYTVPPNVKHLEIRTKETPPLASKNSANLFVKRGSNPTASETLSSGLVYDADCASRSINREQDFCEFDNPSGTYYIMLYIYNSYFESNLVITITK